MIDKDKLIELASEKEIELTREQIDWLVDNAPSFVGKFQKPYEVTIDFSPFVIDLLAHINDVSIKVRTLENQINEALPPKTFESTSQERDPSDRDVSKSSAKIPSEEGSTPTSKCGSGYRKNSSRCSNQDQV